MWVVEDEERDNEYIILYLIVINSRLAVCRESDQLYESAPALTDKMFFFRVHVDLTCRNRHCRVDAENVSVPPCIVKYYHSLNNFRIYIL